jgi:hypothetical protein
LIHLTNKDITVQTAASSVVVNTDRLTCVMMGNYVSQIVTKAIYVSSNTLVCPLTYLVYENTQLTLHVTNDLSLFRLVNQTASQGGGKNFSVLSRLEDTLDLGKVNN